MARDENVRIFQDTEKRVKEDPGDDGSHGPDAGACTES